MKSKSILVVPGNFELAVLKAAGKIGREKYVYSLKYLWAVT